MTSNIQITALVFTWPWPYAIERLGRSEPLREKLVMSLRLFKDDVAEFGGGGGGKVILLFSEEHDPQNKPMKESKFYFILFPILFNQHPIMYTRE